MGSRVLWSINSNFSAAAHHQFSARKNGGTNGKERNGEDETEDEDESLLVRERMATIPNLICVLRIATTPLLGYLVVHEQFWPACILFILSGVTDVLDGSIARHFPSQRSLLGSFLDPIADKFLISTLFITLTYMQLISVPVTIVVFGRDLLLVLGSIFLRYKMLDPPVTIRRFFDTTVSAMQIQPTQLSKYNTFFQLALVSLITAIPVYNGAHDSAVAIRK
uniref:cardiolipin synthase (CMP-forming) n=1 Tax=Globodera pallida TaxID=36090 RepID=A0A183C0Z5_GLOPA